MKKPTSLFEISAIVLTCLVLLLLGYIIYLQTQSQSFYKINVYEADTYDLVQVIEDQQLIKTLVKELDKAEHYSTAMIDMNFPDYHIEIMKNSEIIYDIGYYSPSRSMSMGQYFHYEGDFMYQIHFDLPIHHIRNE